MKREALIEYLAKHKRDLKKEFGVTKIGLFGSFARGQNHEDSDQSMLWLLSMLTPKPV